MCTLQCMAFGPIAEKNLESSVFSWSKSVNVHFLSLALYINNVWTQREFFHVYKLKCFEATGFRSMFQWSQLVQAERVLELFMLIALSLCSAHACGYRPPVGCNQLETAALLHRSPVHCKVLVTRVYLQWLVGVQLIPCWTQRTRGPDVMDRNVFKVKPLGFIQIVFLYNKMFSLKWPTERQELILFRGIHPAWFHGNPSCRCGFQSRLD